MIAMSVAGSMILKTSIRSAPAARWRAAAGSETATFTTIADAWYRCWCGPEEEDHRGDHDDRAPDADEPAQRPREQAHEDEHEVLKGGRDGELRARASSRVYSNNSGLRPHAGREVGMHDVRVVTVTLNPAIDHLLEAPQLEIGAHVRARRIGRNPAGKGINVARVIATLGSRCIATGFVGRGELEMFESFLDERGVGRVTNQLLIVRGRTRDNLTIMDPILDTETHIREQGFDIVREDVNRMVSKVSMLAREGTIMHFGGSLPEGMTDRGLPLDHPRGAGRRRARDRGRDGRAARGHAGEKLWMLKINEHELAQFVGLKLEGEEAVIQAATSLTTQEGGGTCT